MLRSLNVWETDEEGNLKLDAAGHPIALTGKNAGQPKSREQMDAGEIRYLDVVVPKQEEDIAIARYEQRMRRDAILRAALADGAGNASREEAE